MTSAKELKTREDWEEVLQGVETVLFDCDGQLIINVTEVYSDSLPS